MKSIAVPPKPAEDGLTGAAAAHAGSDDHGIDAPLAPPGAANPYPGLAAFKPEAHPFFFGRDDDVERVTERLVETRLLSIVGRSGTGKSSLAAAGVVPRLARIVGPIRYWRCEPQSNPCRQLAEVLCREQAASGEPIPRHLDELQQALASETGTAAGKHSATPLPAAIARYCGSVAGPSVLLMDQFEELFSCTPAVEARRFHSLLTALRAIEQVYVLLTLRSEFTVRLMEWLGEDLFRASLVALEPIKGEERLRAIITGPAAACGVPLQPELVTTLVAAATATKGALPLIALTLERLFEQRDAERGLTLAAYERMGGLASVVESAAAEIERLVASQPELDVACTYLFAELATVIDGLPTRRPVEVAPLRADPLLARVVDALRSQGFLGDPDDRHVEFAHDALFSHWPRLRSWCERYRESLSLRRQAKQAARDWLQAMESVGATAATSQADTLRWSWERQKPVLLSLLDLNSRPLAADDADFSDAGIAAWYALEDGLERGLRRFLEPEPLRLLSELASDDTPHHRREEIGLRLNQMGDPRRGVGLTAGGLPEIAWSDVPAGEVQLEGAGSHVYAVAPFRVSRYAITWQQYNAFVAADDGYHNRRWWHKLLQRKVPGEVRWGFNNYPAINVCWSDATAFCRWLSECLQLAGPERIRLPTEWEWQWLAQSGAARHKYPWGDDWNPARANGRECGVGRTMAVGMYPAGAPAGTPVLDLAGNVWEWCANEYDAPAKTQAGGDRSRTMRGGSWLDYPGDLRTAKREYFAPEDRDGDIGFRVVLALPLEPA